MKVSQIIQSLLLGFLLLGLFAIMAQNIYGFSLMGTSFFCLALLYLILVTLKVRDNFSSEWKRDIASVAELLLLAFLLALFGFRILYISFAYSDVIFIALCAFLIIDYFFIASGHFNAVKGEDPLLARYLLIFYSSVILFLLSLATRIIDQLVSVIIGGAGILTTVPVLILMIRQRKFRNDGRSITIFQLIISSKNKAGFLFLIFIFSSLYIGLSYLRVLPGIENALKPRTYIELINQAETGKEKPINGKYQHDIYKDAMNKFLSRHGNKKRE